jgi:phosphate transport system ATP-binding protein
MGADRHEVILRLNMDRPDQSIEEPAGPVQLALEGVSAWYGNRQVVADVDLGVSAHTVTALIGPSGCGKSTLLRCINRMHELVPGARASGSVRFENRDLYDPQLNAAAVRQAIGMVFQRPNPFPTLSIYDNVATGVRIQQGRMKRSDLDGIVEAALSQSGLWIEVKSRLEAPAVGLSGGQQQRLCIARAIATEPDLLLMDEPCSALDPMATFAIEELIRSLRARYTVVIVTHNLQQASRVSDYTAFMTIAGEGQPGRVVEVGRTLKIFGSPDNPATEAYVTGRVG